MFHIITVLEVIEEVIKIEEERWKYEVNCDCESNS